MRWQHRHQMCSDRQPPAFVAADYRRLLRARSRNFFVPGPRNVRFRIADFPRFSSLCGTKRTNRDYLTMSAVGARTDMPLKRTDFRVGPKGDISVCQMA